MLFHDRNLKIKYLLSMFYKTTLCFHHLICSIQKNVCHVTGTLSPNPTRHSARSIRTSLLRSDVKRHTYTGKRTIQRSMISSPQGDVKHTGHVGLDGAYFGDISFLDPAGCVSVVKRLDKPSLTNLKHTMLYPRDLTCNFYTNF